MFTMIYVNDLAGVSPKIVPAWMRHYHGKSGMTFVDLVFPAFLFIAGMSIPFALGTRLDRGEPLWKTVLHILTRTVSLLLIGVLMVNESPATKMMGWSSSLWSVLMFSCAILAFCSLRQRKGENESARSRKLWSLNVALRVLGLAGLVFLAFAFRGENGARIVSLSPFSIHTSWYGILGLIGWAYLVSAVVFLVFRERRTALLGCMVLLFCLYAADRRGMFDGFWLASYVGIGETLGSQAAITLAGVLLATILVTPETEGAAARMRFTLLFAVGCAAGGLLLHRLYGINKNNATPPWCLWACAITALLWLGFYFVTDVLPAGHTLVKPLIIAGGNVLLAYLLSEMLPSLLELVGLDDFYSRIAEPNLLYAVARSATCAAVLLAVTSFLNKAGFRLKL